MLPSDDYHLGRLLGLLPSFFGDRASGVNLVDVGWCSREGSHAKGLFTEKKVG